MTPIDSDGLMKVEVNGAIHRRLVQSAVSIRDFSGAIVHLHAVPELRPGEVLIETIGNSIPTIARAGL